MLRTCLLALLLVLTACAPGPDGVDGGRSPDAGGIVPPPCDGFRMMRCNGECVPLLLDARHCGACGNACPEGGICNDGQCQCLPGQLQCGAVCANPQTNADHCGACDNACPLGTACVEGACVVGCESGSTVCGGECVDLKQDPANCGGCGVSCGTGWSCVEARCKCAPSGKVCGGTCIDIQNDPKNCGACGTECFNGFVCTEGQCTCPSGTTSCGTVCADLSNDPNNCGGCSRFCQAGQACVNGFCETPCPPGFVRCGTLCVDPQTDPSHCGACGNACGALSCLGGQCTTCNSATTDCDNDGWTVAEGDCCDQPGACGSNPARVNPGAIEVLGNGIDDNCNGLVDAADTLDTQPCDVKLPSNSTNAFEYAQALGLCRTTSETAPLPQRTWGLISAQLLKATGEPLTYPGAASIRPRFGSVLTPREGNSLVVLSSGIASDAMQTNPGPNGGPGGGLSQPHLGTTGDLTTCTQPYCISDWFALPNPPLKLASQLPSAPGCSGGSVGGKFVYDSVMLVLRLRAPTNARAFQFSGYFISAEYPEFVCTTFNDQFVALIDTPGGQPPGSVNPPDKNLMTYFNAGQQWPIGINVAKGTSLFKVCESQAQNPQCWDNDVSPLSCANGPGELVGTGYDHTSACLTGGGTGWLVTSGNVRPGEIVELRIALWDVGDANLDSLALLDGFKWLENPTQPGTTD